MATKQILAALLMGLGSAGAGSAGWTVQVSMTVKNTCQAQAVSAQSVTLLCTKGFTPAQPWPWLTASGAAAMTNWRWSGAQPAPQGGTLNTYVADANAPAEGMDLGLTTDYY